MLPRAEEIVRQEVQVFSVSWTTTAHPKWDSFLRGPSARGFRRGAAGAGHFRGLGLVSFAGMEQNAHKLTSMVARNRGCRAARVAGFVPALVLSWTLGCGQEDANDKMGEAPPPAEMIRGPIRLVDRSVESGLAFVHRSGARGTFTYPEIMSGGVCLADLDGDGDLDIYLPQSGPVPGDPGEPGRNALFLNDGTGKFSDRSAGSGADHEGYGMGAFAADVDDDGDQDLFLTNVGSLALLRNRGDATFEDISSLAGLEDRNGFWLNAAFCDLDQDGILDVYAANYTDWTPGSDPDCTAPGGRPDYCNPTSYEGARDLLLFGRGGQGEGRFEDVTERSGIAKAATRSMGVVAFDAEGDGDLDVYVANDGEANLLWINQGDGTFLDEALVRGVALDAGGSPQASMGIVCADPDGDGDEDLILTHLTQEFHTYYRNDAGFFSDATAQLGLSKWCRGDTGFGVGLLDLDHDQHLDLFVANGAVTWPSRVINPDDPYAVPDRTVRGEPGGRLPAAVAVGTEDVPGPGNTAGVSRGAAFGDLDGDGRIDVVVALKDRPVRLLFNETETSGNWIGLRLAAPAACALYARVEVEQLPGLGVAVMRPHASYLGSSEQVVRFGLGTHGEPVSVVVAWATGERERFPALDLNRVHSLTRGEGGAAEPLALGRSASGERTASPSQGTAAAPASDAVRPDVPISAGEVGIFPELRIEETGPRERRVVFDEAALSAWCERAGLPPPPALEDLDPPTWKRVHPAIRAAFESPSPETLGSLAMYYDGHRVLESARTLYERLVARAPEDSRWWHLLGRVAFDLGDPDRSVAAFEQAVTLAPGEPAGFARLADAQLAAGRAKAAAESFRKYLEQRPRDVFGVTGLARAEEELGQLKAALEHAEAALSRNPRARPALVLAARVAGRLGRREEAQKYGERAAALTKDDDPGLVDSVELAMHAHARSVAYLRAAVNHFKQVGRFEEALEAARDLAERRPEDAQNWQMLTWLSVVLRRPGQALEYARTALEIDQDFAPGWELVARDRLAAGNAESALEAVDRAVSLAPGNPRTHLTRGIVLNQLGRCEAALSALELGLTSQPDDLDGLVAKAQCLIHLERPAAARPVLDRILELIPDHPWASKARSEL